MSFGDPISESLRQRLAVQEAQEAREEAARARETETFRAEFEQDAIVASIALAEQRGEPFNMREAMQHGVGRTKQEFLAERSALMDAEDLQATVRDQLAYERWLTQRSERMSADVTAPTREERELTLQRAKTFRDKTAAKLEIVGAARAQAREDADARERLRARYAREDAQRRLGGQF